MIMKTAITGANIKKNHMDILWHEYADKTDPTPITEASLPAKASVVGRVGIMMLSCGTSAGLLGAFPPEHSCPLLGA